MDVLERSGARAVASGSGRKRATSTRFAVAAALLLPLLALGLPSFGNVVYEALLRAAYGFLYLVAR
jgi:hypothetical protein